MFFSCIFCSFSLFFFFFLSGEFYCNYLIIPSLAECVAKESLYMLLAVFNIHSSRLYKHLRYLTSYQVWVFPGVSLSFKSYLWTCVALMCPVRDFQVLLWRFDQGEKGFSHLLQNLSLLLLKCTIFSPVLLSAEGHWTKPPWQSIKGHFPLGCLKTAWPKF